MIRGKSYESFTKTLPVLQRADLYSVYDGLEYFLQNCPIPLLLSYPCYSWIKSYMQILALEFILLDKVIEVAP